MSRRKPPAAHTWADGGGMVLRCPDVNQARELMIEAYLDSDYVDPEDVDTTELFPVAKARTQRGRMIGALPGSYADAEGWSWSWHEHTPGTSERGTTLAVVWSADR